ncbi:MAG: hypothetical protein QOH23_1171 [Gaiellaceae bacterium]|nr:hypothetical protein [Gaiellaceae bacterium]
MICAAVLSALPVGVAQADAPLRGLRLRATSQRTLQNRRTVRVRIAVTRPVTARLRLYATGRGRPFALSSVRVARLRHGGARDIVIGLTPAGRRAVLGCRPPRFLTVRARVPGQRTRSSTARLRRDLPHACLPTPYRVGMAVRSINPDRNGTFGHKPVYLGGYGIGSPPLPTGRPATGILGPGIDTRAIVISAGKKSIALADIQVQGWFVANKDGPLGIVDMRHRVAQLTHGALPPQQVVIQSDHTHGGPDPIGVWGGVPISYRRYMFNRTVDAIVAAWRAQRPAGLYYGTAPGRDLLSNQFSYDSAHGNDTLDSDVRLLQARDRDGANLVTLLNFSAHSTVLGSSNTKVTGDWESAANPLLEKRFGGQALTIVGTLGRTQPADRGCHDKSAKGDRESLCAEADYANRVIKQVVHAAHTAKRLGGPALVDGRSYLIEDAAHNVAILGFDYVGDPAGIPLNRAILPPWLAGNVLGTATGTLRIGDVLLSVIPGEAYPQIPLGVRALVPGMRGYMTAGLAGDQLGYLIAPYAAYPEPIRSTFLDRGDQPSPLDNDNYAFNVSHTIGSRIECSLLRGAGDVFGKGMQYRDADGDCVPFANDLFFPAGADANGG